MAGLSVADGEPRAGRAAARAEAGTAGAARLSLGRDWQVLRWMLPLALLHGLLYLAIVPPWQHYDEPTHFEYARLIATGGPAGEGAVDPALRRAVADSMYHYRFWEPGRAPNLAGPAAPEIGADQRVHPPLYYALVAQPILLLRYGDVERQLYAARLVGVLLYALVIAAAWRIATVVAPDEPMVELVIPLLLLLTPTFADGMAAVNNDVLVNFCAAALLLGCTLLIRDGLRPSSLALATLALLVGLFAKRTAVILLLPYALSIVWALRRGPVRAWPVAIALAVCGLGGALASLEPVRAADGQALLALRPWLDQFDQAYLRLDLDAWVRSVSNPARANQYYPVLIVVGFTSFWLRFGWGAVGLGIAADLAMAAVAVLCGLGLIVRLWRLRGAITLVQQRCIWLFICVVLIGWVSLFARLHPLPPPDSIPYVPRGRYIFSVMLPTIWLLALGWQGLFPQRWRPWSLPALVIFFMLIDTAVWLIVLPQLLVR